MKIAYIGIDLLYPALESLGNVGCEIIHIFTCNTDNITEFNLKVCGYANINNIPLSIGKITHTDIRRLKEDGCQLIICGGYYYKIPVDDSIPVINIHPSLLPIGRGAWPMPVTIMKGLKKSGVTIHKMTDKLDSGDILLQRSVNVSKDENLKSLTEKLQSLLPDMITQLISDFDYLYHNASPQGDGEYWECPDEHGYIITPDMSCHDADIILRSFYGYECVYKSGEEAYGVIDGVISHGRSDSNLKLTDGTIESTKVRRL